jgi:hypothetical protein
MAELGLSATAGLPEVVSGHKTSLPIPCSSADGKQFLLKFFIAPPEGRFYPPEVRLDDYPRREAGFYRLLDTLDPDRKRFPAPRTVLIDARDPPRFLLLQRIAMAPGPLEEVVGSDHVFDLLERIRWIKPEVLLGRRDFPVNRWDAVSYLDRIRMMYDPVVQVIGPRRWTRVLSTMGEALRWLETRAHTFVHGDFTEQNVVVDDDARAFLVDFERVGAGNEDHDLAWMLAHTTRGEGWRQRLLQRHFEDRHGSRRIASEWGMRAAWIYLALRRLRFGFLAHGTGDPLAPSNLELLDVAIEGGRAAFPV